MTSIFVARQLFESVLEEMGPNRKDLMDRLYTCFYMFKDDLIESLNLVDDERITSLYTNQRQIYEISSNGKVYHCFNHAYYCTCQSFERYVVRSNEILLCKHLIASRISHCLGKMKYKQVKDNYLISLFKGFDDPSSQDNL